MMTNGDTWQRRYNANLVRLWCFLRAPHFARCTHNPMRPAYVYACSVPHVPVISVWFQTRSLTRFAHSVTSTDHNRLRLCRDRTLVPHLLQIPPWAPHLYVNGVERRTRPYGHDHRHGSPHAVFRLCNPLMDGPIWVHECLCRFFAHLLHGKVTAHTHTDPQPSHALYP